MRVAFGDLFEFEQGHGSDGSESGIVDAPDQMLNGINGSVESVAFGRQVIQPAPYEAVEPYHYHDH